MSIPIHPDQLDSTKKFSMFGADMQGEIVTSVGTPVAADDGANKDYVDTLVAATINGFDFKDAVETSTEGEGNVVLAGEQTLNGYLTSTSRVGVVENTLGAENGIWRTGVGAWVREPDADEDAEVTNGLTFFVADVGSSVAGQQYLLTTPDPITVGLTVLTFQVIPRLTLATVAPANVDKSAAVIGTSTRAAKEDHKHDITTAAAVELTDATNAEGASTELARASHTHAHGNRGGGTLHAVATAGVAGFMSAADKDKLDKSSNIITLLTDTDSVNGAVFTGAGGVTIDFATLSLVPGDFRVQWEQVAIPTNPAEVRLQDVTGGVTLGNLLAIASTGLKSFALTVLPAGVAYVEIQHREAVAGAGTSDIRGATLTIET